MPSLGAGGGRRRAAGAARGVCAVGAGWRHLLTTGQRGMGRRASGAEQEAFVFGHSARQSRGLVRIGAVMPRPTWSRTRGDWAAGARQAQSLPIFALRGREAWLGSSAIVNRCSRDGSGAARGRDFARLVDGRTLVQICWMVAVYSSVCLFVVYLPSLSLDRDRDQVKVKSAHRVRDEVRPLTASCISRVRCCIGSISLGQVPSTTGKPKSPTDGPPCLSVAPRAESSPRAGYPSTAQCRR